MHDSNPYPHASYTCIHCGASGVKLWRLPGRVIRTIPLQCGPCILTAWSSVVTLNEFGQWTRIGQLPMENVYLMSTWEGFHPAIPKESGDGYHYVSSIPHYLRIWWIGLPLTPWG